MVLSDPGQALEAIEGYNAWLKLFVQTGKLSINTAADRVTTIRTLLSLLLDREYTDEVEVLASSTRAKIPTVAAESSDVQVFLTAVAGAFDLCAEVVANPRSLSTKQRTLTIAGGHLDRTYVLRDDVNESAALDLACLSFAALAIGDSGANLAQIVQMEYSDEVHEQLNDASIVTMRHKEIKLRAGGKEVPVHFTSVVRKRFLTYLRLRERMLGMFPNEALDGLLFLRIKYKWAPNARTAIDIADMTRLLEALRWRFKSWFGSQLPSVTLRQLRLHTGNAFTEIAGPKVSADRLGHSLSTAIRNYNNGPQSERNSELSKFFGSVARSAVEAGRAAKGNASTDSDLAVGVCKEQGRPERLIAAPVSVEPDCRKTEGCLFCNKYRVHADETDIRKLLSCKYVMNRLALGSGSADDVEAIYRAIMTRIQTLLDELQQRSPDVFKTVRKDVQVNQNLSPYWAARFLQLCLLGVVSKSTASPEVSVW
ncbi:hypothetical protein [Paraburkholderia fungorum]|uniref:hypothetical protein n=1 Tax=Paraburkholderia fungorum TaxID=134537 RepID=UPI001C1EE07D|nr:hypothetical protein [Paraburkholderia fungorum]MBU7435783.1 hypothetical protein [Paraburkholderia fungorum]